MDKLQKLIKKRNDIKVDIHETWKYKMENAMVTKENHILIGFNIFPKDYRIKVNVESSNKFLFNIKPTIYASNQIKFHIERYADMIINGSFPLRLLNFEYLKNRYDKFITYYGQQGYELYDINEIISKIKLLDDDNKSLKNSVVYIATLFKSINTIPVGNRMQIEGFVKKQDAINRIKNKLSSSSPIYVYSIKGDQFEMINGKLIATSVLTPFEEESIMVSEG